MRQQRRTALNAKNRVALALTVLFTLAIVFVTAAQLGAIRESTRDVLAAQQNTLVTRVADEVDEKFRTRLTALAVVAARFDPADLQTTVQAQAALVDHQVLPTLFDTLFLFSPQGQVLASSPFKQEFARINVAQRPYFKDALSATGPSISAPYQSITDNTPYVMMTAPVFGADGKLVGVIGGAISLLKPTFMGRISTTPVGETGYFYVMTRGDKPAIVSHPDRARILSPTFSRTVNPLVEQAQAGFQGTTEGINSRGIRSLTTFKQLKETDWILAAVLPTKEAFGPLAAAQERIVFMACLIAVVLGALTWLLVYWLLLPLEALREHVKRRAGAHASEPLQVRRWDEIGVLTHAFNKLMHTEHGARQALALNEARLRLITDNLPALIGYVDNEQRYRFNNKVYEEWFGVDRDSFYGRTMLETLGPEMYEQLRPDIDHALQGYIVSQERNLTLPGGKQRIVQSTFMPDYGPQSEVMGFYVLTHDITEQKLAQQRLAFLAHHDPLTELPNRASFNARLAQAISRTRRTAKPFALMYLDIDKFKSINDTHGHGTGDQLLKAFAQRLTETVRETDVVGRLGGDEFVVLAEDLSTAAAGAAIAAKIVAAMRMPFLLDSIELRSSTSVGVAICFQEHAHLSGGAVLEWADQALYLAKQGGRNRFRIANADAGPGTYGDGQPTGEAALA